MKNFNDLSEREVLALAISLEEEDERVYADFAEGLKDNYPASGSVFDAMRNEESNHRRRLLELYREKFGEHIPLIRRQDVKGFVQRRPVWLVRPLGLDVVRKQASAIEVETRRFYEKAAGLLRQHRRTTYSTRRHRSPYLRRFTRANRSRLQNCARRFSADTGPRLRHRLRTVARRGIARSHPGRGRQDYKDRARNARGPQYR
jgi:rubrerythrin